MSAANCINDGLVHGKLCVYASVAALNSSSRWKASSLSPSILRYRENIEDGNLIVMDVKAAYDSALKGSLTPFYELKAILEEMLQERISRGTNSGLMFFADIACALSLNQHFEQCVMVEKWWEKTHKKWQADEAPITVIHPHPYDILHTEHARPAKQDIISAHSFSL